MACHLPILLLEAEHEAGDLVSMTAILDNFAAKVDLTAMAQARDAEFAEMLDEFRAAGEMHVYEGSFAVAWVGGLRAFLRPDLENESGGYPKPEIVPMDAYFIETGGRILGEIFIRHRLSAALEQYGGHIGYKVRPSCRNRGVATAALRLALQKLAAIGVPRALLTCNAANVASAR
jgi:predicted acetyltransferase